MLKKITTVLSVLLVLLALSYLSFPWWATGIVRINLPENVTLNQVELDYPTRNGIGIAKLTLQISQLRIDLTGGYFNFKDQALTIEQISIEQLAIEPAIAALISKSNTRWQLPRLELNELFQQIPFSQLLINDLSYASEQVKLRFRKIGGSLSTDNPTLLLQAQLVSAETETIAQSTNYLAKPIQLNLSAELFKTHTLFALLLNQQATMTAQFWSDPEHHKFSLTADLGAFNTTMPERVRQLLTDIIELTTGQLVVELTQNAASSITQSKIDLQAVIVIPQLSAHPIQFSMIGNSDSNRYPVTIELVAEGASQSPIQFGDQLELSTPRFQVATALQINHQQATLANTRVTMQSKLAEAFGKQLTVRNVDVITELAAINLTKIKLRKLSLDKLNFSSQIKPAELEYYDSQSKQKIRASLSGQLNNAASQAKLAGQLSVKNIHHDLWQASPTAEILIEFTGLNENLSSGQASAVLKDHSGKLASFSYQQLGAALNLKLFAEAITGSGQVAVNEQVLAPFELDFNRQQAILKVQLNQHQVELGLVNQLLKQVAVKPIAKTTLTAGELTYQANLEYQHKPPRQQSLKVNGRVKLNNSSIQYQKNSAKNLSLHSQLDSINPLTTNSQLAVEQVILASGLPLKNLNAHIVSSDSDDFVLTDVNMRLMSGDVHSDKIEFKNGEMLPTKIRVNHLSLTELSQLLANESFSAQGNINLNIPISIQKKTHVINNASFENIGGGVIRYSGLSALGISNITALTALQNFHYREFSGTINNIGNHQHRVKIQLLGSNPEVEKGREIELSLNFEVEFPDLLLNLSNYILGRAPK